MKSSFLLLLVLCLGITLNAQDTANKKFNQSFFLGLGGPGFGGSFNYQHRIIKSHFSNGLFFRAGVGALGPIPGRDGGALFISLPIGLHYNFTKSAKFEIGAGFTPYTFTNSRPEVAGFASFAFYPLKDHTLRIVLSPFFHDREKIKYYLNVNSPVLLYGGIDLLLPFNKAAASTRKARSS